MADQFDPKVDDILKKLDLQNKLGDLVSRVISDAAHEHEGSDPREDADRTSETLDRLRENLRTLLGIHASGDIFQDFNRLTKSAPYEQIVRQLVFDAVHPAAAHDTLTLLESSGAIADIAERYGAGIIRERLFGLMEELNRQDAARASAYLTEVKARGAGLLFNNQTELGPSKQGMGLAGRSFDVQAQLDRTMGFQQGITTGTIGLQALDAILRAKSSVQVGMFQMEQPRILQALHEQQQAGRQIDVMLTPTKGPSLERDRATADPAGKLQRVGWMNVVARNLLGESSVKFDPEVGRPDPRNGLRDPVNYAHYKFIGIDLNSDLEDRRVLLGSFNMTRGAYGEVVDRNGNVVRRNPNNFEFGFDIGYEMVTQAGLSKRAFERITDEARDYASWLFDRAGRNRLDPVGSVRAQRNPNALDNHPEHILSGPQTRERIQRSLSIDPDQGHVNAFFMLNVITDEGSKMLYSDIEGALRNEKSTVKIFVSKGLHGLRTGNIGHEDAYTSKVVERLRQLQEAYGERFQVIETSEYLHSKAAVVFRHEAGGMVTDVIGGSANVSLQGMGGQSQDVGFYLSSRHFEKRNELGVDYLTEQSYNVLRYMWSLSMNPGLSSKVGISERSNASRQRLMQELKMRLNPDLDRLIQIDDLKVPGEKVGETKTIGSVVKLGLRVRDAAGKPVTDIHNLFSFRILDYGDGRLYLPEFGKVIDPVLAMRQGQTTDVEMGRKLGMPRGRGALSVMEFDSSQVIAAALDQMVLELDGVSKMLVKDLANVTSKMNEGVGRRLLMDAVRPQGAMGGLMKRMARERLNAAFAHFEAPPLGTFASDARQYKRLVYGMTNKVMDPGVDRAIQAQYNELAKYHGGPRGSAAMLSLAEGALPSLSPETLEASLTGTDWELMTEMGTRIDGNAPTHILRRGADGKLNFKRFFFTVMAQGLPHNAPASLFMAEGFNLLNATAFDPGDEQGYGASVTALLAATKPQQLAQRFQNMLGGDDAVLRVQTGTKAATYLKQMYRPVAGVSERPDQFRMGTKFNVGLMLGLNESALVNAEVMEGTHTTRTPMPKKFKIHQSALVNDASSGAAGSILDGRVRIDPITGKWGRVDPATGQVVVAAEGQPIFEIGADEKSFHLFNQWSDGAIDAQSMRNPIFGHEGGKLSIDKIEELRTEGGYVEYQLTYTVHEPISSSMRMLSQGLKSVFVGTKGKLFHSFADEFNEGVKAHGNSRLSADGGYAFNDTVSNFYGRTFRALGMSMDPEHYEQLDAMKLHMMAGESIVKSGVAFLHTGAFLLRDAEWRKNFRSIFRSERKFREFQTMMGYMQDLVAGEKDAIKNKPSFLKQRFMLDGLDALFTQQGEMEKVIRNWMGSGDKILQEKARAIIDKFDGPEFVVQSLEDKAVVRMAAAYHVLQSLTASQVLSQKGDVFHKAAMRLGGTSIRGNGLPNMHLAGFIPLVMVDNISASAFPMSDRGTANFLTNYTGTHAETILNALRKSPEVERRSRMVGELLSIGYAPFGAAVRTGTGSIRHERVGNKDKVSFEILKEKPNLLIGGVHFNALAYGYAGMGDQGEKQLLEINEKIRAIQYGVEQPDGTFKRMDRQQLMAAKAEAMSLIGQFKQGYDSMLMSGKTDVRMISASGDDVMTFFNLMEKSQVGATTLRFPVLSFHETPDGATHMVKSVQYEQISMLSPKVARSLQSFEDFIGPMAKLQFEIESTQHVFGQVMREMAASGGMISHETRDKYDTLLAKIYDLHNKIREAATTDIQKTFANLGVGGRAMIANTLPGFDELKLGKDADGVEMTIEDVIVLGDEAMMAVTDDAMEALRVVRSHVDGFMADAAYKSDRKRLQQQLKLQGKTLAPKTGTRGFNTMALPEYIIGQDAPESRSVKTIAREITRSFNIYQRASEAHGLALQTQKQAQAYEYMEMRQAAAELGKAELQRHVGLIGHEHTLALQAEVARNVYAQFDNKSLTSVDIPAGFTPEAAGGWDAIEAKVNETAARVEMARQRMDYFGLRMQKIALERVHERQLAQSRTMGTAINPVHKDMIAKELGFTNEKLEILGMGMDDRFKLQSKISQLQREMVGLSGHDLLNKTKILDMAQARLDHINQGRPATSGELVNMTDKDLVHTLGVLGVNVNRMLGELDKNHSISGETVGWTKDQHGQSGLLETIHNTFSSASIINTIQDAQYVRDRLAIAYTRAGSPVGVGGVIGKRGISVRQLNHHLRRLGSDFEIDEQMSRRSMFLHMSGMAIFLGDFDGDNAITATIKRYTILNTLKDMVGADGLGVISRRSEKIKAEMAAAGYDMADFDFSGDLDAELRQLDHQLKQGSRELFIQHAESFLGGLRGGTVEGFAAKVYSTQWANATDEQRRHLTLRVAVGLNTFASDMYSKVEHMTRDMIVKELGKGGRMDVAYEPSDVTDSQLDKIMRSKRFRDGAMAIYSDALKTNSLIQKALTPLLDPGKYDPDMVLNYAVRVAFASTKLIGNWTNIQTMHEAFNQHSKMLTFHNFQNLKNTIQQWKGADAEQHLADIEKSELAMMEQQNDIHTRVSGFMQAMQQAARDAIKMKKTTQGDRSGLQRSGLQEIFEDPIMKAVGITVGLVRGKSMFGHQIEGLSAKSEAYKNMFDKVNINDVIQISVEDGVVKASVAKQYERHAIVTDFINPMVEAGAKMAETAVQLQAKLASKEGALRQKEELSVQEDYKTSALLMARNVAQNHVGQRQYSEYKQSLSRPHAADFEQASANMDDHLKLLFLHEEMRGGNLRNTTALGRVLKDVMDTFVTPYGNMAYLSDQARMLDPTGRFFQTLQYVASGYMQGKGGDDLFAAVQAEDKMVHKVLFDLSRAMSQIKPNPAAPVSNVDSQQAQIMGSRAMSDMGKGRLEGQKRISDTAMRTQFNIVSGILPMLLGGATYFFATGEAMAAQVSGNERQQYHGSSLARLTEAGAYTAMGFSPILAMKMIDMQTQVSDSEKLAQKVMFATSIAAGHVAASLAGRMAAKKGLVTEVPKGERAGGLISMATMMAVGHAFERFVAPMFRRNVDAEMNGARLVEESVSMAQAAADSLVDSFLGELGAIGDTAAVIFDENGDPIPAEFGLTSSDIEGGIATPEGEALTAHRAGEVSMPDVYARPDDAVYYDNTKEMPEHMAEFKKGARINEAYIDAQKFYRK